MTTHAQPKLEPSHPPLARDAAGNLLPFPSGTSSFAVGRETGGRPGGVRGPDKQLLRFPVETTPEDILDLCGPGLYRVYALDAVGKQLGTEAVSRWDLRHSSSVDLRNAAIEVPSALRGERGSTTSTASTDLRFALEAMVQLVRTNTDALRLVAESQVDLAKTISTVKGLPRNAMYAPLVSATTTGDEDEDEDQEHDDEDEAEAQEARPTTFLDLLMPISEAIAPRAADMFPGLVAGINTMAAKVGSNIVGKANGAAIASTASSASDDLASRGFEVRDLVDLGYAHRKGEAKRAAAKQRASRESLQARVLKDPHLVQQLVALKSALTPDEVRMLLANAERWSEVMQTKFLDTLKPLSVDDAVVYCREVIKTIAAHQSGAADDGGAA